MEKHRLNITNVDTRSQTIPQAGGARASRRQEIQASMERLWHLDPEQFNPMRDCVQRRRVSRTVELISPQGKLIADIGCGAGYISRALRDAGATVHAVDVAGNALQSLKSLPTDRIVPIQDCLPMTKLEDNAYDDVVCTEVIGFLKPVEYRVAFAELSRIVKANGFVICSTSLDTNSDNALERFAALAETEFVIDRWILDYNLLWMKICRFFEIPRSYARAAQEVEIRNMEEGKRSGFTRSLFRFNTSLLMGKVWGVIALATNPVAFFCRQSPWLMNQLERVTRFLWNEAGITHALFLGTRRRMIFPLPQNEIPTEMKHKRQVWE
ncbi:MAG: class I SAM-dependent methyltransferase [Parachlamydiaceae bacterium]